MKKLIFTFCLIVISISMFANLLKSKEVRLVPVIYKNECGVWKGWMHYASSRNPVANQINFYNRFEQFVEAADKGCAMGKTKVYFDEEPIDEPTDNIDTEADF